MKLPPMPAVPERAAWLTSLVFAAVLLAAASINYLGITADPYRCGALLRRGSWLDPPSEHGDRAPYKNWQPDGCMLRKYSPDDIRRCMDGRHMVFSGDSTTRQVFWAMARLLDSVAAEEARQNATAHSHYDMTIKGVRLVQIWNPYLDSGETETNLTPELDTYRAERFKPAVPVRDQKSAAIIMLGVGSWFALHNLEEEGYRKFTAAIDNVTDLIGHRHLPRFGTRARPIHPVDGTGNEVFIAPVHPPWYDELPEKRKTPEALQVGELESYNEYLAGTEHHHRLSVLWSFPALSHGQPETIADRDNTGFHVIDSVAEIKATILLNLRCNAKLDAMDGYPHDRTCCTDYGRKPVIQQLLLALGALYVAVWVAVEADALWRSGPSGAAAWPASSTSSSHRRRQFLDFDVAVFVATLLCCHYFDRTQMLAKGSPQYIPGEFRLLCGLVLLVALFSLRRSHARPHPPAPPPEDGRPEPEMGPFLSREQTDEWKGWMQLFVLIYHWTGAQTFGTQVFFRLCVAAYLFQTGYGHTVYFLTTKDFSFHRVASTLLRLNLLSCALPYVMNTQYTFYYAAPLVSFWFLVVWATMAIGSKYNFSIIFLASKIVLSAVFVCIFVHVTPFPRWTFAVLRALFGIDWDVAEWEYRITLDPFIVAVGMATAVAHQALQSVRVPPILHYLAAFFGVVGMFVFWLACKDQMENPYEYAEWHPYASFLPVLCFVALRNIPGSVRMYTSRAMGWVGRCSLETFTLHFHIFLAADTKGVLRLGVFGGGDDGSLFGGRWRDLVFIVPFFLWISSRVASATVHIVKLLTDTTTPNDDQHVEMGHEPKGIEKDADGGPEYGPRFGIPRVVRDVGSQYSVNDVRVRMGILLGVMWLLNLLY
ncbi:hypothetical protein ACRALDRAFT_2128536 [Sodiomyces alcalophilus JCM 7366]|uniref:uncharacterized protein n=1 Tax=Sodiomyces alcalophilus JCM 7366 TaxID=591952 RepID=UPI0039B549FB